MPFGGVGVGEMILIFLVVLLLFGAKRLPEIGSALGKGIREFKGSVREIEGELKVAERQQLRRAAIQEEPEPRRTPEGSAADEATAEKATADGAAPDKTSSDKTTAGSTQS